MKKQLPQILRELFFGILALVILYDQVFIAPTAQAILVFLAIFFLGSIPALRGDKQDKVGPFARFIMAMMGVSLPSGLPEDLDKEEEEEDEKKHGRDSSTTTPTLLD